MVRFNRLRQIFFCGLLFAVLPCDATAVDMAFLHKNDSSGKPAAPFQIGTQVTVEGLVTAGTNIYSAVNFEVFLQDSSGGINIFLNRSIPRQVKLGDLVRITGTVQQYRGLTEIFPLSNGVVVLSENHPVPDPLVMTCSQVANSFLEDFSEPNESRLIRINDAHVTAADGYSYTLQDHSGACILFHDPDAKVPSPPTGTFDVIGILKQYDSSTNQPLAGGYEISPRFITDFISKSGPILVQQPREMEVAPHTVRLQWRTDQPATSLFRYGTSESSSLEAVGDSTLTTMHVVSLANLQPATLYRGTAVSSDSTGTSQSRQILFMTSSIASTGEIKVFFSKSVDPKYAGEDTAQGNIDLSRILIDRIKLARFSIDVCYYSFTHSSIAEALRNAKKRGISVRFIYEFDNAGLEISGLKDLAGIPLISDRFGENYGQGAMHDKFVIIDHRDKSSALDDYLWVGSGNASYSGSVSNGENMLLIQDETICAGYTLEFNEMWGSDSETPDPVKSRFGFRKTNNTPHRFNLNGVDIEQYMSPSDDSEEAIIEAIAASRQSVYFCLLAFTSGGIAKALENHHYNTPGFQVRGIFERSDANGLGSEYPAMAGQGSSGWQPPADVLLDVIPDLLHHKYAILDPGLFDVEPRVITGSHNWSANANTVNDENVLIIHDRRIANLYIQEFAKRYSDAGGVGQILSEVKSVPPSLTKPDQFALQQNYPNPFNQQTALSIWLPENKNAIELLIYDLRGSWVKTIVLAGQQSGWVKVQWDGKNERGEDLATGVYFARLSGVDKTKAIKMVLIR